MTEMNKRELLMDLMFRCGVSGEATAKLLEHPDFIWTVHQWTHEELDKEIQAEGMQARQNEVDDNDRPY